MQWQTLAPTALGGLLAIAGGFLGQWWSSKQARIHDRDVWARGLRQEAHTSFLATFDEKYKVISDAENELNPSPVPEDWLKPVWDRYQALRLVCTRRTTEAAHVALVSLNNYAYESGRWEQVDYDLDRYLGAVREEFGLPAIPLMGEDGN